MALVGLVLALYLRNRRRHDIINFNIQRRHLRDNLNPFELRDYEFKRLFRVDRETAQYLIGRLNHRLSPARSDGLSVQIKVLVALRFFGFGCYQRVVGQGFYLSISQPSVSRCVRKVSRALYEEFLNETIHFPSTVQERYEVESRFREPAGFPGVLGCIDCTHIAIFTPSAEEDAYKNHHGYYSLNVQMICDERLKIINVNANFPGSVHDQFIFMASQVRQELMRLHVNRMGIFFLLGDSGYAVEKYMLTPVLNALPETPQERYTMRHCQVRNRIERLFGVLKARWRCLRKDRVLHYTPRTAALIVYSCAILHNLLLNRFPLPEPEVEDIVPELADLNGPAPAANAHGDRVRDHIINTYFN